MSRSRLLESHSRGVDRQSRTGLIFSEYNISNKIIEVKTFAQVTTKMPGMLFEPIHILESCHSAKKNSVAPSPRYALPVDIRSRKPENSRVNERIRIV